MKSIVIIGSGMGGAGDRDLRATQWIQYLHL
jgi:hypothetical protein